MERNREKIDKNGKINDYITVLNAYLNGEVIEYRDKKNKGEWKPTENPIFDFHHLEYRVKPKPAYRPYINGDEAFNEVREHTPFGWLYNTLTMCYEQIIRIASNGISTDKENYSFDEAFDVFIYPNETKFGVKLDEKD